MRRELPKVNDRILKNQNSGQVVRTTENHPNLKSNKSKPTALYRDDEPSKIQVITGNSPAQGIARDHPKAGK